MNLKEIREIIKLMNENELVEIEIERDGTKIKLKKASDTVLVASPAQPMGHYPTVQGGVASGESVSPAVSAKGKEIKSPMVGTFYRSPSPESPPFVESGQVVEIGQVVCIVEAMKLMNEIKSEVRGKVVEIPVDNAQPVEFGQTLFVIEPV